MDVSFRGGADFWLTLLVSALLAQLIALLGYDVFYSDSHTYTHYAVVLSKHEYEPSLGWRTMGYPALLLFTGFTATGSLAGILVLQAVTGAAMPLVARMALHPLDAAPFVGWAMILSLVPYCFMNTIYPDQLYIFALTLTIALLIRWILGGSAAWLAGAFLSCLVLTYLRPAGLVVVVTLIVAPILQRRHRLYAAMYAGLFFVLILVPPSYERYGAPEKAGYLGAQVFYNAYLWSDKDAFTTGSAAAEMRARIRAFFAAKPDRIHITELGPPMKEPVYQDLVGRLADNPEALVDAMFGKQHLHYYWLISSIMNLRPDGGRILLLASLRHYLRHPDQIIRSTFWNYIGLVLGPPRRFNLGDYAKRALADDPAYFEAFEWLGVVPGNNSFVTEVSGFAYKTKTGTMEAVQSYFSSFYPIILPLSYLLMLVGLLAAWRPGPPRQIILMIFSVHTINALPLAILVDSQFRYQMQGVPLAIIGAAVGVYWLRGALVPSLKLRPSPM